MFEQPAMSQTPSTSSQEVASDEVLLPVYQPVVVQCGIRKLWKVEEHKHAVIFLKKHLKVTLPKNITHTRI